MALPAILGGIGAAISLYAGYTVTKILVALGLGYFIYQGMDTLYTSAQAEIAAQWGALPGSILAILLMCGAGKAVSILMSAFATRILLDGFQAGVKAVIGVKP